VQKGAEFLQGDMRDRGVLESALDGVQVVFHQAAYGGYMPEISKYVAVNSLGTAQLLEIIREKNLGVRKIVVASSQVVYPEGAGQCAQHSLVFPGLRPLDQLRRGDFSVPLSDLSKSNQIRADARVHSTRRRDGLRYHQARPGKTGSHVGKTGRCPDGGIAVFVYLSTATVDI
jgi:nucleoside-diphosphate-sugar epimerase